MSMGVPVVLLRVTVHALPVVPVGTVEKLMDVGETNAEGCGPTVMLYVVFTLKGAVNGAMAVELSVVWIVKV